MLPSIENLIKGFKCLVMEKYEFDYRRVVISLSTFRFFLDNGKIELGKIWMKFLIRWCFSSRKLSMKTWMKEVNHVVLDISEFFSIDEKCFNWSSCHSLNMDIAERLQQNCFEMNLFFCTKETERTKKNWYQKK